MLLFVLLCGEAQLPYHPLDREDSATSQGEQDHGFKQPLPQLERQTDSSSFSSTCAL